MKTLMAIPLMLFLLSADAQSSVSLKFTQDVKLAITDDDYGNEAFTPDVRFEFNMNGNENKSGDWLYIGWNVEYADLRGGSFLRYGFHGGYTSKRYIFNLPIKVSPNVGAGIIHRKGDNRGWMSLELGLDLAIRLTENLDLVSKTNLMQRGDLIIYNSKEASYRPWHWKPNWSIGIEFHL